MHSKPSRTLGNVSYAVLRDAMFLPHETVCADFNCEGEARAMYRKTPFSQVLWRPPFIMRTREHPPADIDRQTTPSWNPNGARWLGDPTYPSVAVLTPQTVICGVGLAARTGRGEISQAGKHTNSKRRYEYTTRNKMKKCYASSKRHMRLPKPSYSDNMYQ